MPIYEYICRACQSRFEALVTTARPASCPECHGQVLDKQFSVFAVSAKAGSGAEAPVGPGACGTCGDPRGPGSCSLN